MTRYNITYLYRDNYLEGNQTLFREHILGRTIINPCWAKAPEKRLDFTYFR